MAGREPGADVPPGDAGNCSVCGDPAEEIVDGHLICPDCLGEMVEAGSRLDEMIRVAEENPLDVRLPSE